MACNHKDYLVIWFISFIPESTVWDRPAEWTWTWDYPTVRSCKPWTYWEAIKQH